MPSHPYKRSGPRVAIYVRMPPDAPQRDYAPESSELQRFAVNRFTNPTVSLYEDDWGQSRGREFILTGMRALRFDAVIVRRLEDVGSTVSQLIEFIRTALMNNVALICVADEIDTLDNAKTGAKAQEAVFKAVTSAAERYHRFQGLEAQRAARSSGKRVGRPTVPDAIVERIRRLQADGLGIRATARELDLPPATVHSYRLEGEAFATFIRGLSNIQQPDDNDLMGDVLPERGWPSLSPPA